MYANAIISSTSGSPTGTLGTVPIGSSSSLGAPQPDALRGELTGPLPSDIYEVVPTIGEYDEVERKLYDG